MKLIKIKTVKKVKSDCQGVGKCEIDQSLVQIRIDLDNIIARRGFRVANFNRTAMMVDLPVFVFPV